MYVYKYFNHITGNFQCVYINFRVCKEFLHYIMLKLRYTYHYTLHNPVKGGGESWVAMYIRISQKLFLHIHTYVNEYGYIYQPLYLWTHFVTKIRRFYTKLYSMCSSLVLYVLHHSLYCALSACPIRLEPMDGTLSVRVTI